MLAPGICSIAEGDTTAVRVRDNIASSPLSRCLGLIACCLPAPLRIHFHFTLLSFDFPIKIFDHHMHQEWQSLQHLPLVVKFGQLKGSESATDRQRKLNTVCLPTMLVSNWRSYTASWYNHVTELFLVAFALTMLNLIQNCALTSFLTS